MIVDSSSLVSTDTDQVLRRSSGPLTEEERIKLEAQGIQRDYHHSDKSIAIARYQMDKECGISGDISGGKNEVMMQILSTMKNTNKQGGKT